MTSLRENFRDLRPALSILSGASVMLSLAMGLRQCLGLFTPQLTQDLHISVSDFTVAIAVQNLTWGFLQPIAGALIGFGVLACAMVPAVWIAGCTDAVILPKPAAGSVEDRSAGQPFMAALGNVSLWRCPGRASPRRSWSPDPMTQ